MNKEVELMPLGNHVAVELNEVSDTNKQGVVNPEASKGKSLSGTVIAIPPKHGLNASYFTEDGSFGGVKVGDQVMVHKHGGSHYGNVLVIKYGDLICKIK